MKKSKPARSAPATVSYSLCRLPNLFLNGTRPPGQNLRLAVGLDLGTRTGYAATYYDPDVPFDVFQQAFFWGQLDLSLGNYDSRGLVGVKLGHYLEYARPDVLFFEDVVNTPANVNRRHIMSLISESRMKGEYFGGLKMVLASWGYKHNKPVYGLGIKEIKQRATGRGNAGKSDVIQAFNELFGQTLDPLTYEQTGVDNLCDATFALILGLESIGNGVNYGEEQIQGRTGCAKRKRTGGGRGESASPGDAGLADDGGEKR